MEVGQVLLVREDDGLVLSDDLAPEALPARGQFPQLLQFTHSARRHTHQAMAPAPSQQRLRSPDQPGGQMDVDASCPGKALRVWRGSSRAGQQTAPRAAVKKADH